jgi:hypothetical protein
MEVAAGRLTSVRLVQSENASSPITVIDGNVISPEAEGYAMRVVSALFNNIPSWAANAVLAGSTVMVVKLGQPENALLPTVVNEASRSTDSRLVQPENASWPMVWAAGRLTDVRLVQPWNA